MISPMRPTGELDPVLLERVRAEMIEDQVPGVALGVYHEGRSATAGIGVTNVAEPRPVGGETLFQIGSITKTFTLTALLQLVDEGGVGLDDPLQAHLPSFAVADPQVSREATIRDCLTHSVNWDGDVFRDTGWGDDALQTMVAGMSELRQVAPLRRLWSYNNAAFYPLGRILEVVHGRPYETVVKDALLRPLGMDDACFFAHDLLHLSFAVGHARADDETIVARPWAMPRSSNPVGGLAVSAEQLMNYVIFWLKGAWGVLSDDLRRLAMEPAGPAGDTPEIGLGWWLRDVGGEREVSHGGGANGQPCLLAMLPSRDFALVLLTNASAGWTTAHRLLSWIEESYFGLSSPSPGPSAADDVADRWAGTYESHLDRWILRRGPDGHVLDWIPLGEWLVDKVPADRPALGVPLRAVSAHTMLVDPDGRLPRRVDVLDDETGRPGWLRIGLRANVRREAVE